MAKQTTTKQAAVWKPPRLSKLSLGSTDSGIKSPFYSRGNYLRRGSVLCAHTKHLRLPYAIVR